MSAAVPQFTQDTLLNAMVRARRGENEGDKGEGEVRDFLGENHSHQPITDQWL